MRVRVGGTFLITNFSCASIVLVSKFGEKGAPFLSFQSTTMYRVSFAFELVPFPDQGPPKVEMGLAGPQTILAPVYLAASVREMKPAPTSCAARRSRKVFP